MKTRKTIKYLHLIFHIGWNIHTVQATIGPDEYNAVNTLTTEIIACFGDMVAKCLFCFVVTLLRMQVCKCVNMSESSSCSTICWFRIGAALRSLPF